MLKNNGAAVRGGYVRAVFSGRVRGFAAPLALMVAQLRGAARLARMRDAEAHSAAMYARLADWSADYLVCDPEPPFSDRRAIHAPGLDRMCITGSYDGLHASLWVQRDYSDCERAGWHLDAPDFVPSGSVRQYGGDDFVGVFHAQRIVSRGFGGL